ncbi:tetratricopeptide repeat protein [Nocardia brasiliensis]|uniref:tetratricopeptide repeat protein n=1 Tax=Nocardia brasiliensis TaxID=37326 RepID=UPI00245662FD|nr:tetratricopeptide repeat protein [Nocardia brasiliensis]
MLCGQEIGHRRGEANALGNLGLVHRDTGEHAQAAALLQQALVVSREIGHRIGEAVNLNYLATVHREAGDYEQATALSASLDRVPGHRLSHR